jgi:predicted permease
MSPLTAVLPVFLLIALGALMRRTGVLGGAAASGLNRFVVSLALPAMLFAVMANADRAALAQPRLVLAFAVVALVVYLPILWWSRRRGASLTEASLDGLCGAYANTGFIGIPLAMAVLGDAALPGAGLSVVVTACMLFALALVVIEFDRHRGAGIAATLRRVLPALACNPLLWAPAAGAAMSWARWRLPDVVSVPVELLAACASPCALVAIGLFLVPARATPPAEPAPGVKAVAGLVIAKLLVQPMVAWLVAVPLLQLPLMQAQLVVLMAALPTGTGASMLAERAGARVVLGARVMAMTTVLSLATIPAWLALSSG